MSTDRTHLALRVDVLGPLALWVHGVEVAVPGVRRRALLALLALDGDRVVGAERLVESLWPDEAPENAVQALYNHVSRLRGHLGPLAERLERRGTGYLLHVEPGEVDADAARALGRAAADGAGPAEAAELARAALDLWRGPALEEFRALPALEVESVGLDELRLQIADDLVEARLALGDRTVTADAVAASAAAPLRERSALLLVRALAADGRAADAMAAATAYRRRLADETGLDPGAALAELEQAVAAGSLEPARPDPRRALARPDGPLIGRQQDRDEVVRLLDTHAAVTLTGPGGVGKTRLALDIAGDPAVGGTGDVALVDLAAVDRPDRLCQAVASTLGLRTGGVVGPADIAAALATRSLLIVLDNCEHLAEGCRDLVVSLRRDAPGVRVLATSRVTLHVPEEYVVRLQPLPVPRDPTDLEALRRQAGVRAFVEHARRRRPGFELGSGDADDVVEVLRRLDGLPLGIELAARQVAVMPLSAVRDRLDRALDLATGAPGEDDRQRTLRASIDSSYQLLSDRERRLLCALAPFPGGVDLETVESLAAEEADVRDPLDLVHRLVDASLLVADAASGRFRLLFTVRAFLLDELERTGRLAAAEERFLDQCLATAGDVGRAVFGADEPAADRRLRAELDNLRAARDVALAHGRDDVRVGITLGIDAASIWRDLREPWAWALELAADPRLVQHPQRPLLLGAAAVASRLLGAFDQAERLAAESLAMLGPDPDPKLAAPAWDARAGVAHFRGDFRTACDAWLRAGEGRTFHGPSMVASAALAASYGGDASYARELLDRARAGLADGPPGSVVAFVAYVEAEVLATRRAEEAVPFYLEAIEGARRCGANFVDGVASVGLASARTRLGDVAGAADGFGYLLDAWQRTGQVTQLWTTARNAAELLAAHGRPRTAALLLVCADQQPGAAAVSPTIARHSGRVFVALDDLVPPGGIADLHAEVARLTPAGVLALARRELDDLARTGPGPA